MAHRDIVVIGASASGLQALKQILSAMPRDVEAALLVVLLKTVKASTDEYPATLTGSNLASRQPASMRRILPTSAANGGAFHGSPE